VNVLGIPAQPDPGVVPEDGGDRGRQRVGHDVGGGRFRRQRPGSNLGRLRRRRAERPDVLGSRLRQARPGGAQAPEQRVQDVVGALVELHLDLPEARRDPAPVQHRDLVVDHLGQPPAAAVEERDTPPPGRKPGDGHEGRATNVRPEEVGDLRGRRPGRALEAELRAGQHRSLP
jgi:hypothetical protein